MAKAKILELEGQERERVLRRFAAKVAIADPGNCWEWLGSITDPGYGQFSLRGVYHGAHRMSYALFVGSLLDPELTIDHLCRNRSCVNPGHLELVTFEENMRRKRLDVVTHCSKGHPFEATNAKRQKCKQCFNDYQREYLRKYRARKRAQAA